MHLTADHFDPSWVLLHPVLIPTPIHPPSGAPSALFDPLNTSHNAIGALQRAHALLCPAVQSGVAAVAYASRQKGWEPISFQDRRNVMWKLMWCRKGSPVHLLTTDWKPSLLDVFAYEGNQKAFWTEDILRFSSILIIVLLSFQMVVTNISLVFVLIWS